MEPKSKPRGERLEEGRIAAALAERRAAGDLVGAGELAEAAGEFELAARAFEEACAFERASAAAVLGRDWGRAVRLAAIAGEDTALARVVEALAGDPAAAARGAVELERQGRPGWAGRLHESAGDPAAAALAYELAGEPLEAARCHRAAGADGEAARVLEAALVTRGGAEAAAVRVALGELYGAHGRHDAALRVLQPVAGAPWRALALPPLARALAALGLDAAAAEADAELAALGGGEFAPERNEVHTAPGGRKAAADRVEVGAADEAPVGLFGRYDVVRTVAETPHARVLEAVDRVLGERVALKVLGAHARDRGRDAAARFVEEARALGRLRHPHVVPLLEYFPSPPTMVLAWMDGGALDEWLARAPCSPARAVEIALALLDALAAAHRLGIVHRDVKPSNVLFDGAGTPRLADFGAAHLGGAGATMTGGAIGTLAYMAPEQRRGEPASVASDLYAIGALLHEIVTGAPPSGPATSAAAVTDALGRAHPDLDERHGAALAGLLADAPAARPASAAVAAARLRALGWSDRAVAVPRSSGGGELDVPGEESRLGPREPGPYPGAGVAMDRWLAREVVCMPADADVRARAAAWARAGHPGLAAILRVDPASGDTWVERPRGTPLADGRLDPAERALVGAALADLHAVGGWHGAVDGRHVFRGDGEVMLAFPVAPAPGDAEGDLRGLAALAAR